MRCLDNRRANNSFIMAQQESQQLVAPPAVLHAIPRKTEFDLWPIEFGISPTSLSILDIDAISDSHIKALLFELKFIRVDVKRDSHIGGYYCSRDTFMYICI